jgi:pyruvate/2-oxoglutarate/acetoin dehydrogenase E1 component
MYFKKKTLRETISAITESHLKKFKTLVFGQNLLGVGQVDKTLPKHLKEKDGIIDLPMADVAGGGIVTGAALAGKSRPFYIIRYQGYNWFNMIFIINYACKSKAIWNIPCPIWIRGIASEGNIGPVAGSSHISQFYKMPGIKIFSPINSEEYIGIYKKFLKDDDIYYISEHRKTYSNSKTFKNKYFKQPDVTLMLNSITRHSINDIERYFQNSKNFKIGIINLYKLKPFILTKKEKEMIKNTKKRIIICDNDYTDGLPSLISSKINNLAKCNIDLMGLPNKTAGHHSKKDILPPNALMIIKKLETIR